MNPLLDEDFLVQLNKDRNRVTYARIISLDQYEYPIEQLEGVVTAGSITIDGQSAVRRIAQLTLSAKNLNINNVYWGLETKIKIEIGLQNHINTDYDDIIWFKLGVFILADFKTTQVVNNYTINLSAKDKMCLLNGDVSGNLPAPVIFDSYDDSSTGVTIDASGSYNFFADNSVTEALLDGLNSRYSTDYLYVRGIGRMLSIIYTPASGEVGEGEITFTVNPKPVEEGSRPSPFTNWVSISSLVSTSRSNGKYILNLGDNNILGFQVRGMAADDKFSWDIEQKIPIALIIQELIHQFGQERYSNIIIKDIEPFALEMLDNKSDDNYYLLHNGDIYINFVSEQDLLTKYQLYMAVNDDDTTEIRLDDLVFRNYVEEDDTALIDIIDGSTMDAEVIEPTQIIGPEGMPCTIMPVESDEVAGYGMTLLVYPEELKGEIGDSVTSILDKIVNFLGDYEYFYDLNGQFVFQGKPAYIKTPWNGTINLVNENYVEPSEIFSKVAYTFDDAVLTTQYQNTPNLNNIKNDYIIWGERKNLSGNTINFHGRYAIDNIPHEYTDFNGYTWTANKASYLYQLVQERAEVDITKYGRQYDKYPPQLSEDWWEVNDWANYYRAGFGVNLLHDGHWLREYGDQRDKGNVNEFTQIFIDYYNASDIHPGSYNSYTDVIVVTFTDTTKTKIKNISHHGTCSHYYGQFADLRALGEGWVYDDPTPTNRTGYVAVHNIYDDSMGFPVVQSNHGNSFSMAFHPDYCTAFIHKPTLPSDMDVYVEDTLTEIVYPDAVNENGRKRCYAVDYDVDWRELIHIMADDWLAHNHEDDYEINLRKNNSWPALNINLFPYGRTNFEQYYIDFFTYNGYWAGLYNIYALQKEYYTTHSQLQLLYPDNWTTILDMTNNTYYMDQYFSSGAYKYWNKDVIENPEKLLFWFDFFQADQMGIGKFAVSVIGDRPKTINDSTIKVIIYRDTPDVIYCTESEYEYFKNICALKDGYQYIVISDEIKQKFSRSARGKTIHEQADKMLYQYSYYNDNVSISNVPIYYLQPNTIISIKDDLSQIIGYYIMNKIDISLAYNGLMNINAIKSPERIY